MERRLAAVFAADMVGFSRLMEADEMGTLTRQKRHRAELIDPRIEQHGGRIIKLTGDGMIAEFPSVVEAVQCAVSVQREMDAREADVPEERKIRYRVAVNLGDVIFDDEENDVYGDGVNIAARLEALAEPGGVVVSGTAYDHLKANVEVGYEDLGEQQVKNIATPVRVYRVLREGEVAVHAPQQARRRWPMIAAAVAVLVAPIVGGAWWLGLQDDVAETDPILALPKGPKIVVLPFHNLSGDPDQDYFVDGLTEDLTTRLTRHGYLFVVARNSAFKYKGKSPDVRDVGEDLGVDYVLEGSVRRSEDRIRVNAQLLNAADGTHMWAQTFDKKLDVGGLFAIQDALTIGLTEAVGGTTGPLVQQLLEKIEATPPEHLASYECVLLADRYYNTFNRSVHARARDCLEEAVSREPEYALGWAALGQIYHSEHFLGANPRPDPLDRSMQAVDRALKLQPDLARAVSLHARLSFSLRLKEDALSSLERSLKLEPNLPERLFSAADQMMRLGYWERGAALWNKAIALSPTPSAWVYWAPIHYHHWRDEPEKAYEYVLLLKERLANWYWTIPFEAILLVEMGKADEARDVLTEALEKTPNFPTIARSDLEKYWWPQPEYIERSMGALYEAGLPKVADASN